VNGNLSRRWLDPGNGGQYDRNEELEVTTLWRGQDAVLVSDAAAPNAEHRIYRIAVRIEGEDHKGHAASRLHRDLSRVGCDGGDP
jgi:hypothetical protein